VFAGQDLDAAARARSYFAEYQPSSPSIALLRDGEVVHFVHRHMIEGRGAETIARDLVTAFEKHCAEEGARELGS
jgi:putative YphP/YqiW family bacilliredoxin